MIRLRALEPEDADLLYLTENDPLAFDYGDMLAPFSREILEDYAENYDANPLTAGQLRLVAEDHGEPIGLLDFYEMSFISRNSFVGIIVRESQRGKGYATKILQAGCKYAQKRLGMLSVAARIHTDHEASLKIFHNCGFETCGIMRKWHFSNGSLHDIAILQKLLNQ